MGSGYYYSRGGSYNYELTEEQKSEKQRKERELKLKKIIEDPYKSECGVQALNIINKFINKKENIISIILEDKKISEICDNSIDDNNGLTCKDLRIILEKLNIKKFDCRYCSQIRHTDNFFPFPEKTAGLVALKFKNNNNSHWVSYFNGNICFYDDNVFGNKVNKVKTIKSLKENFPDFDGFGHRLVFWDANEKELEVLKLTNSIACKGATDKKICNNCVRESFCFEINDNTEYNNDILCKN